MLSRRRHWSTSWPTSPGPPDGGESGPRGYTAANGMQAKLSLDEETISHCRRLARDVGEAVRRETEPFTTVSTERAVLRLLGVDGVDGRRAYPLPNRIVEALGGCGRLGRGAAPWLGSALASRGGEPAAAADLLTDQARAGVLPEHPRWREALAPLVESGLARIAANRGERERRSRGPPARRIAAPLCDCRHGQHLRRHPAGPGRRPCWSAGDRGHSIDGAVSARPRSLRTPPRAASAAPSPRRRTSA